MTILLGVNSAPMARMIAKKVAAETERQRCDRLQAEDCPVY